MNETYFKALLQELIDENPFSVRAVLKILDVEFTDSIPTLAVTREKSPKLLVNLNFLKANYVHRMIVALKSNHACKQ